MDKFNLIGVRVYQNKELIRTRYFKIGKLKELLNMRVICQQLKQKMEKLDLSKYYYGKAKYATLKTIIELED